MAGKWIKVGVPILIVVGSVVLASAFVAGKKPPEQKKEERKTLFVEVKPVNRQNLTYQVWSQGSVQPKVITSLTSEVNGVIVKVADNFIEGGFFRAGDLLIQVEQYDYLTAVKLAEANLARAQALLEEEKARGKVAAKEWSEFSAGQAPELGLRRPQLAQELANVRSAEAELENAKRNLIRTEIRAPYDGIVKLKNANIGQFISRGFNLGTIYGTDLAEVRLPLSDNDIGYLNMPGLTPSEQQQPEVLLLAEVAGQQLSWNAKLVRTEGMLDDENRVIYAVAEVKDPYKLKDQGQPPLRFGRFVKARIDGKTGDNLVLLERHLLKPDQKVLTISNDNKLHIRSVTVQRMDEDYAYISAGLEPDEQLVLTAIANPLEGMALRTGADPVVDEAEKSKTAIAATEQGEKR